MAAPLATAITLPSDTGNSGKNVRTQTRVVGAVTVHEHFFIPIMQEEFTGKYFWSSTQQTAVAAAQNATATGFFWLQLPTAATVTAIVRRISADANASSALATPTAPRLSFSKFTFTGTASGASVAPVPFKSAGAANQMIVRTAPTGMTITVVGDVGQFAIPTAETAAGTIWAHKEVLARNPQAFTRGFDLEIAPGEGLAIWQSTAGTVADTRTFGLQIEWQEMDLT
jgi:hypothetical protein